MTAPNPDTIARAYSRLLALKTNLPLGEVELKIVNEYHDLVESLAPEVDVAEFRIPSDWLVATINVIQIDYLTGKSKYGETQHVPRHLFLTKVDGLLHYLEILGEDAKADMSTDT